LTGNGGYQSVSLLSGGSGYTQEPGVFFATQSRLVPERVGEKTWSSVSSYENFLPNGTVAQIGVSDGKGYFLFGDNQMPAGRGVKITAGETCSVPASPGGPVSYLTLGVAAGSSFFYYFNNFWGYADSGSSQSNIFVSEILVDPPVFGVKPAIPQIVTFEEQSDSASGEPPQFRIYDCRQTYFGWGYTEVPRLTHVELDPENPVLPGLSAELVGPDGFERVSGRFFIDSDGMAWDPFGHAGAGQYTTFVHPFFAGYQSLPYPEASHPRSQRFLTSIEVEETTKRKTAGGITAGGGSFFNTEYSYKASDPEFSEEALTYRVSVFRPGTGNSEAAPCSISGTSPTWGFTTISSDIEDFDERFEILCNGGSNKVYDSFRTKISRARQPPLPYSSAFSIPSLADGRLSRRAPFSYWQYFVFPRSVSPPLCVLEGNGSLELCEIEEAQFRKAPGVVDSRGDIVWMNDGSVGHYFDNIAIIDPLLTLDRPTNQSRAVGRLSSTNKLYTAPSNVEGTGSAPGRVRHAVDLEISLDSPGGGYTEPPVISIGQPPGTAIIRNPINGKARGAAIIRPGAGFHSPPALTVTANDGTGDGASLESVIQGPVYDTKVTSGGSGYRCPPEVLFSKNGVPGVASASCSGAIGSVTVADGGSGFRSPPAISFSGSGSGAAATAQIKGYVQYVTVTNGGSGYTSEPVVSFSGGGSGATAIPVLSGDGQGKFKVARVIVTSGGSEYTSEPSVSFSGGGGSGASASATLDAAITSVQVTSGGSGYATGTSASAGNAKLGVTLSMAVDSIDIQYGGRYRRQPTVSLQPFGHIESISLTNGGSGYSSSPLVGVVAPCGGGAKAECRISASVASISVLSGGQGYVNPPLVELVGGYDPASGRQAKAHAVVSGGVVSSIAIDDGGAGYFQPPTVSFAKYVEAILKCTVSDGAIEDVEIVSGGYGYAAAPTLYFTGGSDATATASVSGGRIQSVTLTAGGSGYSGDAKCLIVSGIGTGASAAASISGAVSSVSITDCGYGFEPGEPVFVFFSGGGGDGAAATASISTTGAGAAATARINGSVVAVKITSQGSGYQTSPSVSVDMSNNFLAENPSDPDFLPYIQLRIAGPKSGANIVDPGQNYALLSDRRFNTFALPGGTGWGSSESTSLGGPIESVPPEAASGGEFSSPQEVYLENSIVPHVELSCLSGAFSVDVGASGDGPPMQASPPNGDAAFRANYRPALMAGDTWTEGVGAYERDSLELKMIGPVWLGKSNYITKYSWSSGIFITSPIGVTALPIVRYSPGGLPEVFVVDTSGEGAAASASSTEEIVVSSPGGGYTLDTTFYLRGGRPESWDFPPVGNVAINSTTGTISGTVIWSTLGSGNNLAAADVYLDGGREDRGAVLPAGTFISTDSPPGFLFTPSEDFNKRKFSSAPRVVVVSREKPSHRMTSQYYIGAWPNAAFRTLSLNEAIACNISLSLSPARPESVVSRPTEATIVGDAYPVPSPYSQTQIGQWKFYRHWWDGSVSYAWIDYPEQARTYEFSSPPLISFSLGGGGGGAAAHSSFVLWSPYFSDSAAVRVPPA
jgi:hypothetical protein